MPQGPAARLTDKVAHPLPGVLGARAGKPDRADRILPAWRAVPTGGRRLQAANQAATTIIKAAEATTAAAVGPAIPAAYAAEQATKAAQLSGDDGHRHERRGRCGYLRVRHTFARSAARPRRRYRRFDDRNDELFAAVQNGRHHNRGRRPARQDRKR